MDGWMDVLGKEGETYLSRANSGGVMHLESAKLRGSPSSCSQQTTKVSMENQHDLTKLMVPYLDRQLVYPLVHFLTMNEVSPNF